MEIIIGRDAETNCLNCIVDGKSGEPIKLGKEGTVPGNVSRKHCKLTVNEGTLHIENLKDINVTYVDGVQVFGKTITADCKVELGPSRHLIPLKEILDLVSGKKEAKVQVAVGKAKAYSLAHLEKIWDEYDTELLRLQELKEQKAEDRNKMMGARMTLAGIPVVGGAISSMFGARMLAKAYIKDEEDKEPHYMKVKKLENELIAKYVCPNPDCGYPFGKEPYYKLKFRKKCPHCGCKYTSE